MVKKEQREAAQCLSVIFRALGDPTRRAMLEQLQGGECSILQLAEPFDMSLAGAAKHVQVLDHANLISRSKRGRTHYCQLNSVELKKAYQWLQQYSSNWNMCLDRLENLPEQDSKTSKKKVAR